MADDVQPISGTEAILAARLCNLPRGSSALLPAHHTWIESKLVPIVRATPESWVDIIGYASRLGEGSNNQRISNERCNAVANRLRALIPHAHFNLRIGKGENESSGASSNDDGYWRAAEAYAYTRKIAAPQQMPSPQVNEVGRFKIRMLWGFSLAPPLLHGVSSDLYRFEVVDLVQRRSAHFEYATLGLALPNPVPLMGSGAMTGPYSSFTTSRRASLDVFEGRASFYQDPGVSIGRLSPGGQVPPHDQELSARGTALCRVSKDH
jgi:hypothetical protein